MDLTKIDKPFGGLDIETKLAMHRLRYAGQPFEVFVGNDNWTSMSDDQVFWPLVIYRLKPEPLRDITLPWAVMRPEFKWAARDKNGGVYAYTEEPSIPPLFDTWRPQGGESWHMMSSQLILDPGNKPWQESLVKRPDGV